MDQKDFSAFEVEPPEPPESLDVGTAPLEIHARLVCVAGADLGASFLLDRGTSIIGRGAVAIRLGGNAVSRNHARITNAGSRFYVEDLGSRNATLVNGAAITGRVLLRYSDRIHIGDAILVFTYHDELETRVRQLQRLDAMTAAAAGMAHDFRNALQVIGSALDQLEEEVPAVTAADPYADIKRATASAAGLAQRLVDLGRGGPVPQSAIDVGAVVADAVAMARRVVDRSIAIHVDVPAGTFVRGSSDELQQVLLNLCLNARDAMPQGGTIAITASTRTLDRDALSANLLTDEGRYVELTVADNGVGMPPAVLARVFEPFFTTKEPGKGTGLGLAMTHAIVKKHGGAVSADSRVGGGTTIKLLLPCRSPSDG